MRNLFLLVMSYVFYGWWDWRFLSLILVSTLIDFWVARSISHSFDPAKRKKFLWISITANIGMLGFFKYFGFFTHELISSLNAVGFDVSPVLVDIVLPVGISFYTFQTLSYTIDVYKQRMESTQDFIQFAAYVSFFPQLVAGPIERASSLLPQFGKEFRFEADKAIQGFRLICWGLFKKVVIADTLAPVVNQIFKNHTDQSGLNLILGGVFFAFQIYGDFSGYSDIAIGSSKLLGFELMSNFKFPYFSRDIAEFWRRWHISLSSWFRDYLYIPLGGSRGSKWTSIRNVFIIFLMSGFWHGANWTFIAWGGIHAMLFLPLLLLNRNRLNTQNVIAQSGHKWREWTGAIITFFFVCLGWVFFRAESVEHALSYLAHFNLSLESNKWYFLFYPLVLLLLEWRLRFDERLSKPFAGKWEPIFLGLILFLVFLFRGDQVEFIYFQF